MTVNQTDNAATKREKHATCPKCGRKDAIIVWRMLGSKRVDSYCKYKGCDYESRTDAEGE